MTLLVVVAIMLHAGGYAAKNLEAIVLSGLDGTRTIVSTGEPAERPAIDTTSAKPAAKQQHAAAAMAVPSTSSAKRRLL